MNAIEPTKSTNANKDLIVKMNKILEMFEDQKEIKTGQKNEEIVLYCFLGVLIPCFTSASTIRWQLAQ